MVRIDEIICKLRKNKISKETKLLALKELEQKLEQYKSGSLKKFKDTAIYRCFDSFYRFYSQKLSNQTTQSNSS